MPEDVTCGEIQEFNLGDKTPQTHKNETKEPEFFDTISPDQYGD